MWSKVAAFLALGLCVTIPAHAQQTPLRIGILAVRGAERAATEWEPTLHHLATSLPDRSIRAVPLDLPGLVQAVRAGNVDFVITNPGQYVELEAAEGVVRIASIAASPDALQPRLVASAVVVQAKRSDLRGLADLKASRLAAVAPDAFGGFRVAWRELASLDIDPFTDAAELRFLGFPMENIVDAVARGDVDAGIVRACLIEDMVAEGRIRAEDFRVLDARINPGTPCMVSTRAYPDWPFAKVAHTSDRLAKRVALALLAMPAGDGPVWTVPVDYTPVHDLFRDLRIGPYEALRHRSLSAILHDNWPWAAIVALAALWWVIHVARVEYLVRRRTEELKQAHDLARRHREEMEHGARLALLGEMASSLAHEINQPLAAISNYASGCAARLASGDDPQAITEAIHRIVGQAERAAAIVRRMRAFVRKRVSIQQTVDINEPVREALALFSATVNRRGIRVSSALGHGLPMVRADRLQVEQVVLNLLKNAADAMAASLGPDNPDATIALTTGVTTALGTTAVEVTVSDCGPGLSDDARAHLFEPFFTTKPDGLGLGLSLSRSIAEAHGGRLWADTPEGGGARFHFAIPPAPEETP